MEKGRVRAQLERILASRAFAAAERHSTFLRFVVEGAIEGRSDEIKESVIAIEALGRKPSFDSKSDPIVRVEAGRLRDRLRAYYQSEGDADRVLIALPKGGYVPEFSERQPSASTTRIDVLRLSILPPDHAFFHAFAVSPDGRHLAFTAALNGQLLLWVRALDALDPQPLIGTDNAAYPFWSPDSRTIGFFTPNKLKTIAITGGPALDIADVVVGRGGAWSPAGVIVFCPRPLGILYQVAATGGRIAPVTSLDALRAEVAHGFPQFLPDGDHFIYLAMSSRAGESSIRASSLDSTTSKVVLEADTNGAYAPALPGHPSSLLFVAHGTLMSQPFDAERLELQGDRTVLVPHVRYRRWHQASFSVSNDGVLFYQAGSAENQQFSWVDRQGTMVTSIGPRNDYISFSLSPDERYVAFYRDDDPATAHPKIWVMDLLREGAVFRLTELAVSEPEFTPIWSPDGREILFSRGDDRRMRLLRQSLSGGAAACVLDTEGPKFPTDWSSDGRFITYTSQAPDYRNLHTWTVSVGASDDGEPANPWLQHAYNEANAYFSPDGTDGRRWVAYASAETGRDEVYVREFPDGAHKWQVSNQGGLMPHWRRDGRELFYLTPDGILMAVPIQLGATCEVGPSRTLFGTGVQFMPGYKAWMNQYAVARDGQRFLFNRPVPDTVPRAITAVIPW
jgi:Tol biopolymer transport system component